MVGWCVVVSGWVVWWWVVVVVVVGGRRQRKVHSTFWVVGGVGGVGWVVVVVVVRGRRQRCIVPSLDLLSINQGGKCQNVRWDHRLQIQNLFMALKRVLRW